MTTPTPKVSPEAVRLRNRLPEPLRELTAYLLQRGGGPETPFLRFLGAAHSDGVDLTRLTVVSTDSVGGLAQTPEVAQHYALQDGLSSAEAQKRVALRLARQQKVTEQGAWLELFMYGEAVTSLPLELRQEQISKLQGMVQANAAEVRIIDGPLPQRHRGLAATVLSFRGNEWPALYVESNRAFVPQPAGETSYAAGSFYPAGPRAGQLAASLLAELPTPLGAEQSDAWLQRMATAA